MSEVIESIDITMPNGEIRRFSLNNIPFTDNDWVNLYIKEFICSKQMRFFLEYISGQWWIGVTIWNGSIKKAAVPTKGGYVHMVMDADGDAYAFFRPIPTENVAEGKLIEFSNNPMYNKRGYCHTLPSIFYTDSSLQPIISKIVTIERKVTKKQYTDNDVVNSCIVEMYETGGSSGSGRSFKFENNKWYFFSNYNYKELQDGLNVFNEVTSGIKIYIIWKGISGVQVGSYNIKTGKPVIDISYSPAIASYIAAEKLIEDKLSSITNP